MNCSCKNKDWNYQRHRWQQPWLHSERNITNGKNQEFCRRTGAFASLSMLCNSAGRKCCPCQFSTPYRPEYYPRSPLDSLMHENSGWTNMKPAWQTSNSLAETCWTSISIDLRRYRTKWMPILYKTALHNERPPIECESLVPSRLVYGATERESSPPRRCHTGELLLSLLVGPGNHIICHYPTSSSFIPFPEEVGR